jgi:hypothetical protein
MRCVHESAPSRLETTVARGRLWKHTSQEGLTDVCHARHDREVAPLHIVHTRQRCACRLTSKWHRQHGVSIVVGSRGGGHKGEQCRQCRLAPGSERADLLRHAVDERALASSILLQLFRSRPFTDGTRGVSKKFRDQHVFSSNVNRPTSAHVKFILLRGDLRSLLDGYALDCRCDFRCLIDLGELRRPWPIFLHVLLCVFH